MKGEVIKGKIVFVDMDAGKIRIDTHSEFANLTMVDIDTGDCNPGFGGWEGFLGCEVEAKVVDGKLIDIREEKKAE